MSAGVDETTPRGNVGFGPLDVKPAGDTIMSWRIGTSPEANQRLGCPGHLDYIIGRDGSAQDCARASWGHAPVRVVYAAMSDLSHFATAWSTERDLVDIWDFTRAPSR